MKEWERFGPDIMFTFLSEQYVIIPSTREQDTTSVLDLVRIDPDGTRGDADGVPAEPVTLKTFLLPAYNPQIAQARFTVHKNTDSPSDFRRSQAQTHDVFSTAPKPFVHDSSNRLVGFDFSPNDHNNTFVFSILMLSSTMIKFEIGRAHV